MPSIDASLKHEAENIEAAPGRIRLITSGEFARAYNRSAWLFHSCISKYKVIRKFHKPEQKDIYFLGFPTSKLLELVNGRSLTKTDFGYDILLKPEEVPSENGYETWMKEVPVEAASRADAAALPPTAREVADAVCRRIRAFPLEARTPLEAMTFLGELRKALSGELECG